MEKVKILHQESNFYETIFVAMVFIQKEGNNSLNEITDIENLNSDYNFLIKYFLLLIL